MVKMVIIVAGMFVGCKNLHRYFQANQKPKFRNLAFGLFDLVLSLGLLIRF